MRSLEAMRIHVRLLVEHIGHLEPHQVHDTTLAPFISKRIGAGVSATTINRSLEVARTILHRAARSYRDENGRPWLEALPPLITMLPECPRSPYPITWEEQDRLFPKLPGHLARMALFAVNTGLRDSNVCGLQWTWEVFVPEIEPQRLRRARRGLQGQATSCGDPQRHRLVDHPDAAGSPSRLGVSLSGRAHCDDEQHGLAERAPRSRAALGARA